MFSKVVETRSCSYAINKSTCYGYHSRSNPDCWWMLRCTNQIGPCYCLFINCPRPESFFRVACDKFIFVDRTSRDRIDKSRFIHARLIDFDTNLWVDRCTVYCYGAYVSIIRLRFVWLFDSYYCTNCELFMSSLRVI